MTHPCATVGQNADAVNVHSDTQTQGSLVFESDFGQEASKAGLEYADMEARVKSTSTTAVRVGSAAEISY